MAPFQSKVRPISQKCQPKPKMELAQRDHMEQGTVLWGKQLCMVDYIRGLQAFQRKGHIVYVTVFCRPEKKSVL